MADRSGDATSMDLRHLAVIFNWGAGKAAEYQDAALASALSAMSEAATVMYLTRSDPADLFHVDQLFAELAERLA